MKLFKICYTFTSESGKYLTFYNLQNPVLNKLIKQPVKSENDAK